MKRGLVPLFLAVLAPAVLAQDQGIFGNAFSLIFGSVSGSPANDMVLKVGLWLALTMVLFQGAQKIFKTKDANGQEIGSKKLSSLGDKGISAATSRATNIGTRAAEAAKSVASAPGKALSAAFPH